MIGALLSRLGIGGVGMLAVVLIATPLIVTQGVRLGRAQDRLETAQAQLATCRTERAGLEQSIADQNAAIAELEAAGVAQAARARAAAQAAAQARADADARVRAILAAQVPAECAAAVEWGAVTGADMARRWAP